MICHSLKCGLAVAEVVKTFGIFVLHSKLLTSSATCPRKSHKINKPLTSSATLKLSCDKALVRNLLSNENKSPHESSLNSRPRRKSTTPIIVSQSAASLKGFLASTGMKTPARADDVHDGYGVYFASRANGMRYRSRGASGDRPFSRQLALPCLSPFRPSHFVPV